MNTLTLDRLGGVASACCSLHCLTMAFAPAIVTLLAVDFLAHESFEWGLFAAAVTLAITAAGLGFRAHRNRRVLMGFGAGVAVLMAGRLGEAFSLYEGAMGLAVAGGFILVLSHVASARETRACKPAVRA